MKTVVTWAGKYSDLSRLAEKHHAEEICFQYHVFVDFRERHDAESFSKQAKKEGFDVWDINTQRPYVPFEVIVSRWS